MQGGEAAVDDVCSPCPDNKADAEPSPYFLFVVEMFRLSEAGFPFGREDLPLEIWQDMFLLKDHIELKKVAAWNR